MSDGTGEGGMDFLLKGVVKNYNVADRDSDAWKLWEGVWSGVALLVRHRIIVGHTIQNKLFRTENICNSGNNAPYFAIVY